MSSSPTTLIFLSPRHSALTHFLFTFNPLHWNFYPHDTLKLLCSLKSTCPVTSYPSLLNLLFPSHFQAMTTAVHTENYLVCSREEPIADQPHHTLTLPPSFQRCSHPALPPTRAHILKSNQEKWYGWPQPLYLSSLKDSFKDSPHRFNPASRL